MEAPINFAYSAAMIAPMILGFNFFRRRKDERSMSSNPLPEGWQFYDKPTTLEPPGTVFRIDRDNKRYIVDHLKIGSRKGEEAFGRIQRSIVAKASIIASFLGLTNLSLSGEAGKNEQVVFEMQNLMREYLTDMDIDPVIKPFLEELDYRVKNKYYIIRDATSANEIDFQLSNNQVFSLGGEASLNEAISVKGEIVSAKKGGLYILQQKFDKPMRIMFLPEEIKPISAGLGGKGPELGLVPVKGVLDWDRT